MRVALTKLEYALLGLLAADDASGYALRKLFQDTPLGMYSDSPGSIYPALRRLETRRLIAARGAEGPRRLRVYTATARGRATLIRWLRSPLVIGDVTRGTEEVDLRLAFLSDHASPAVLRTFLQQYGAMLSAHARTLRAVRRTMGPHLSRSSHLALDLGITSIEARAAWCRRKARNVRRS
jgi:DNA-binding PadR family transcriptional regulator